MKNKMPRIQMAWRQYKELWDEQQSAIYWVSIVLRTCDIILLVVPYIFATYFHSAQARSKKFMGHRKNRNL